METILLVEDEDGVRNLVSRVLRKRGYKILEANGPRAAIHLCATYPERIDLLLTDVVMPQGTGPALAREVISARPDIRVLYMSGYTDTAIVNLAVLEEDASYLQKPFTPDALAFGVRQALAK
jgi:DNA-binding NtrC family response regulator